MRKIALFLIKIYQSASRLFPAHCIYTPTCSEYARQAFSRYPFLKAARLTIFRIIRCNPFSQGGVDPLNPVRNTKPTPLSDKISNGVK